jgi:hypothetical protein
MRVLSSFLALFEEIQRGYGRGIAVASEIRESCDVDQWTYGLGFVGR